MGIVLAPDSGSVIKNFQIITNGSIYNGNVSMFYQGVFLNGKLNGPSCRLTNYSSSYVNIRVGPYTAGNPDGTILEYVFPKALWTSFSTGGTISVTRYAQVFNNGVYVQTDSTNTVDIRGSTTINGNGYYNYFTFSEV